jgi:hypothetical protein
VTVDPKDWWMLPRTAFQKDLHITLGKVWDVDPVLIEKIRTKWSNKDICLKLDVGGSAGWLSDPTSEMFQCKLLKRAKLSSFQKCGLHISF